MLGESFFYCVRWHALATVAAVMWSHRGTLSGSGQRHFPLRTACSHCAAHVPLSLHGLFALALPHAAERPAAVIRAHGHDLDLRRARWALALRAAPTSQVEPELAALPICRPGCRHFFVASSASSIRALACKAEAASGHPPGGRRVGELKCRAS